MVRGRYGEFKVFVDDETVIDAGWKGAAGLLPSSRAIVDAVKRRLAG